MREGDEFRTLSGGRKKFLYSGPVSGKRRPEDDEWSFTAKSTSHNTSPRAGVPVDLDNVWSIRNVSLGGNTATSVRSEPVSFKPEILTKTTNTTFYSRHGGMNGRGGSPKMNNQDNTDKSSNLWSSSGHKLGSSTHRLNPPTFQNPTDKAFKKSRSKRQNPSPFDYDMNDF